jgi:hypothetical protein
MILTPVGNIVTKQLVINAPLNLGGKVYKTHLIVLDGQGIDVILGMSWMRDHKALLDTASRTMQLDSPDHGCSLATIITLENNYLASSYHRPKAGRHSCCM